MGPFGYILVICLLCRDIKMMDPCYAECGFKVGCFEALSPKSYDRPQCALQQGFAVVLSL